MHISGQNHRKAFSKVTEIQNELHVKIFVCTVCRVSFHLSPELMSLPSYGSSCPKLALALKALLPTDRLSTVN